MNDDNSISGQNGAATSAADLPGENPAALPVALPVALITGAARRIGAEIARLLHHNGYRIIIHCNNSIGEAQQLADELNAQRNNSAIVIAAELATEEGCEYLMSEVLSVDGPFEGRLNVLINNASVFYPTAFYPTTDEEATDEQWQQLFATNLRAPFLLAQKAAATLKKSSGSIINITDIHGERPLKGYSIYCMTKAGLISMTRSLSEELAPNVRVNGVSPGAIMWPEAEIDDQEKQKKVLAKIPLGRMGAPRNIAGTVLFLLENTYITGQIIKVDGGRSV